MSLPPLAPALNRLLAAVFIAAIAVPFAGTLLGVADDMAGEENRETAPWPDLPHDRDALAAWPEAFTRAFADHFAFRSQLVRWQALVRVEHLHSSPTSDVVLGRGGWLFYAADGAMEDYAATRPFSRPELDAWRTTLQDTQDWLAARGIAYVFVIAPDKHWIYPEYMPDGIGEHIEQARIDQLVEELRARSTVAIVDVRDALRAARPDGRLYHLTDTHWNDLGAFVAYEQVMRALEPQVPLHARERHDLELRSIPRSGMDLARMLGLGRVMVEDDLQLEPKHGRGARIVEPVRAGRALMNARVVSEGPARAPRAVVFRDSFASAMIPFLAEHFSRAVYLWQNDFDPQAVLNEKADVVIQEWVGRHLYNQAPYDAMAAATVVQQ